MGKRGKRTKYKGNVSYKRWWQLLCYKGPDSDSKTQSTPEKCGRPGPWNIFYLIVVPTHVPICISHDISHEVWHRRPLTGRRTMDFAYLLLRDNGEYSFFGGFIRLKNRCKLRPKTSYWNFLGLVNNKCFMCPPLMRRFLRYSPCMWTTDN